MSNWVRIGVPCVCIAIEWEGIPTGDCYGPKTGEMCIIESVGHMPLYPEILAIGIKGYDSNRGFDCTRFRPATLAEINAETFRKIASNLPTAKEMEDSVQLALERLG